MTAFLMVDWKRLFLIAGSLILLSASAKGQSVEETAILKFLEAETAAFTQMSFADVARQFWILDDKTLLNVTFPDGTHLHMDRDAILADDVVPPENHATFSNSEYRFTIKGDIAFVSYTQVVVLEDGAKFGSHEMRLLEKVNGEWKIHMSSVQQYALN